MTGEEAIYYIEHFEWNHIRLGLGRTRELLERMDNPQKGLKFIHVAGSNGKGSTCAMLASILEEAGYKVGLYTSPHIEHFTERMQINGENIPMDTLARITEMVRVHAEAMEDHPSQFEMITAIAFQYFLEEKCNIVVLEVGMGGEIDSTNIIDPPEVAVIANIGLEHTEYLGNTIEEIAHTKAGIIKPGSDVVCYDGDPRVTAIVRETCAEKGAFFTKADFSALQKEDAATDFYGQSFTYKGISHEVALLGKHQLYNCAVVLEAVEALKRRGFEISDAALARGLRHVKWPARLEVLNRYPLFFLDGGHNPQCAKALMDTADELFGKKKIVFVLGILRDKDYEQVIDIIRPRAKEFFCLTPLSDRALPAEELAEVLREKGCKATAFEKEKDGVMAAIRAAGAEGCVVCFGSLYLAGEVRKVFH